MIYNRTKSTTTIYEAGRLRCWLRDPPLSSKKSALLPALLLVARNGSSEAATWFNVKFPPNMASYVLLDADKTRAAVAQCPSFA